MLIRILRSSTRETPGQTANLRNIAGDQSEKNGDLSEKETDPGSQEADDLEQKKPSDPKEE
jgi:hypothetical protein